MIANQANLLTLLEGRKQFVIPIYQRTYSWTEKQCRQLWDDLIRTASSLSIPAHFIGSIVYVKASPYDTPISATPQLLVIDGQQRLTTLTLLLAALREALLHQSRPSQLNPEQLRDYVTNKYVSDDLRHKLVLTQSDKDTLAALLDGSPTPSTASYRVLANYRFFESRIKNAGCSVETIFHGIQKLMFVDIALDRSHDNPQLIFESLNSTGLDLSQADLIRNFVLMGQEPAGQTRLYRDYWYPMEREFGQSTDTQLFDRFMRDYLTIKLGRIPNIREVYAEFKAYVHLRGEESMEQVVAAVARYASYFMKLYSENDADKLVRQAISDINTLRVDVAYPFLMEVYSDYTAGHISATDVLHVFRLVESYVFRRAICSIPTNSLNNTFAALHKEVDLANYIHTLETAFMRKDSYRRFPRDDEFKQSLTSRDIYSMRNRGYLLSKLENYQRHEAVDVSEFTIEHIMPQTLDQSPEWLHDLGDDWSRVHETYLHTLGNLTLTGYNSEYSNRSFMEKRNYQNGSNCGFKHSPLHLNEDLRQLYEWNEAEIRKRAAKLADKAVLIWQCPNVAMPEPMIEIVSSGKYSYEKDAERFFHRWLDLFDTFRDRLSELDPDLLEEFKNYWVRYSKGTLRDNNCVLTVNPQASKIILFLMIPYEKVDDPLGIGFNAATIRESAVWARVTTAVYLTSESQIEDVMHLVQQTMDWVAEQSPAELPDASSNGDHRSTLFGRWLPIFEELERQLLRLDPSLQVTVNNYGGIFRKGDVWLVSAWPQATRLKVFVDGAYSTMDDPERIAFSAADIHRKADWAPQVTATFLTASSQIHGIMDLARQASGRLAQTPPPAP